MDSFSKAGKESTPHTICETPMATTLKTKATLAPELKEKPEVRPPLIQCIRTVHGPMLDLFTNTRYTQIPQPVGTISSWVQSQLDAGKMVLC
jgi:hypothetical protein